MRSVTVLFAVLVACTKPNPNVCCVTEEQCNTLGADELRPCGVGQACSTDFSCVAAECETSADCTSSDNPVCSLGLCVSTCRVDEDCADVAERPFCAPDGVCVGCIDAASCSGDAPICDAEDRTCRGCERDSECESGVCIEADGACANAAAVLYVSSSGTDAGACTEASPCETVAFAISLVTSTRNVIHVLGGLASDTTTITLNRPTIIDGTGTRFTTPANGPMFSKPLGAPPVTIEGIEIVSAGAGPAIDIAASTSLRLFETTLDAAPITNTGTLELRRSLIKTAAITCTNGTLTIEDSRFEGAGARVFATSCQSSVSRNRFLDVLDVLDVEGGQLIATNNLFTVTNELTDAIGLTNLGGGSTFAFNTIVNTSAITSSGEAIQCDASANVTSSIIAYNSTNPLGTGCVVSSSVFDLPGANEAGSNPAVDAASIFVDLQGRDFHLAPDSAARGMGEAGIVDVDLEGHPRPATMPDVGAFEADD